MRLVLILAMVLLAACGTDSTSKHAAEQQESLPAWYNQTVEQLTAMDRQAERLFQSGKSDEAAGVIEKAEPLEKKLVSVPHPTLAAIEAASDLDHLYGQMLLSNRHYAWARLQFQKNLNRWKHWSPQTAETARRLKQAQTAIDECDRHLD